MISYAYYAHILASSPPEYIGTSLAPLKTTCHVRESGEDKSDFDDEKIFVLLEKLKKIADLEKNFSVSFKGFLSPSSCYASLAKIFHNFFNVKKENILKCLMEIDVKSVISFLGGFLYVGKSIQKFSLEKIGMLIVKERGEEKPSPYVKEMKDAMMAGNIEKMGVLCEEIDVPPALKKLWDVVHGIRGNGLPCFLSLGIFPLIITYPEIIGEIINTMQIKNFDVEIAYI